MDIEYKNEGFVNLSVKSSVAKKFRKYSRSIKKSQSMTLLSMILFFEYNNISPSESLGPNMHTLELAIKKRINSLIAIVRDIEKTQTLPTQAMLQALFEGLPVPNKNKINPSFEDSFINLNTIANQNYEHQRETDHKDIRKILSQIEKVNPRFGKPYWKINLNKNQIIELKNKYHVYNH